MAKVLSSISRDSPASPVSANTGDSFTFAGTPTLTGGGGAQRYDFKWEVNHGNGYVAIGSNTGLTTTATNPVINTNSQTQNSITVTCTDAGSYTIRMAGAPTSGGSYTIFSPTQTVTATAPAAIVGTMTANESGTDTFAASGTVADPSITGTLAAQETGSDTLSATGAISWQPVTGSLTAQETGSDTASINGTVPIVGLLNATEAGSDTFTGSGSLETQGITGTLAASETGSDTLTGSGLVLIIGGLSATESGSDIFSGSSPQSNNGTMLCCERGEDTFTGHGSTRIRGWLKLQPQRVAWGGLIIRTARRWR